ncbi:MAG TPA: 1-deoxy-D-xylulose-5-phosphate synthase [Porphyromonadaceae bacterium]|nr:1-deoxy-D-xylulose-5-phosphate synthase [Porphyromonadaceae bacterium]
MKQEDKFKQKKLLPNISLPEDLRRLGIEQLGELCSEVRDFLIQTLSQHPGHFASSLSTVELTVAMHYVFHTPEDKIVWDVGHQAYTHKLLTGRKELFDTLRQYGGLSGFPHPKESPFDAFISGHASNSISAALGISTALQIEGKTDRKVIAVIGDGALTGGLAFEGLNNISTTNNNLLVVLNDNEMAIDENVGGLSKCLLKITTGKFYNKMRWLLYTLLRKRKPKKNYKSGVLTRLTNSLKSLLSGSHTIFEGLNVRYFGPVDGHDVMGLVKVLSDLKRLDGPKVLHIKTIKGKGFSKAEENPTLWHAPGRFNPETGERLVKDDKDMPPLFQEVFGKTLVELAEENEKIVGITPAMPTGCSMNYLFEKYPLRAFDVGIAEGHAVTFSAGMSIAGLLPYCNIYSSFAQRSFDQIIHDVALQNLRMVLCLDRAGIVGEDGATHHGIFDLPYLSMIPNLIVSAPMNEWDLRNLMYLASRKDIGTLTIRYPRGRGSKKDWHNEIEEIAIGKGRMLQEGRDIAFISIGFIGNVVEEVVKELSLRGVSSAHYNLLFLKPLDEELLNQIGEKFSKVVTVEDGVIIGGMGEQVADFFLKNGYSPKVRHVGVPNCFVEHGSIAELHHKYKMDKEGILEIALECLGEMG